MPKHKIRNIIFDLGNTLVYFDHCYFWDRVAKVEKKLSANRFKKFISENKLDIKQISGKLDNKTFFKIVKKKFDLKLGYSDFKYFYSDVFWENPPMKRFLEKMSRLKHYRLFLLSNTDSPHMKFIDDNFPYVRLLRKRVLSYKVKMYKPQLKIFRYIIDKYKLNVDETLLIDDMKENIISASKLGINTIQYTNHKKFVKEFSKLIKTHK